MHLHLGFAQLLNIAHPSSVFLPPHNSSTTPSATLQATLTSFDNATQIITASITNTGSVTAAFVEVLLVNSTAQPPVPLRDHVLLSDNFITLLPAETRNITVSAPAYFFNHFIRITADAHALPRIDS